VSGYGQSQRQMGCSPIVSSDSKRIGQS